MHMPLYGKGPVLCGDIHQLEGTGRRHKGTPAEQGAGSSLHKDASREPGKMVLSPTKVLVLTSKALTG